MSTTPPLNENTGSAGKASAPWALIQDLLIEEKFAHHGFAALEKPLTLALYRQWLDKGYAGEMDYLARHLPYKEEPSRLMAKARSAIVVAVPYVPEHPKPGPTDFPFKAAQVARYARGEDYHFWLKARLSALAARLQEAFPEQGFACFSDSAPVLERDLAYRAGLGWIGKNTCVIHPKRGSLFLIGEIYTTLDLAEPGGTKPLHDFCGTCTRCLDACPTGALVAPRELDARRCISYLTIESRQVPDESLRTGIGQWLFGCDICQTVCPWNIKLHGPKGLHGIQSDDDPAEHRATLVGELRMILTSSNSRLMKLLARTPLTRAGGTGLKRNAIIVAVSAGLTELHTELEVYRNHPRLGALAGWALDRLTGDGRQGSES